MNAEHAIGRAPGTGTIVMRTQSDGRAHTLQVSDDGPGISPELRGRVFEPFFTTKDVGEGTGLGLSISLGIATAHGGALTLCDTAKGACFQLMLPTFQAVQPTATLSDDATARQSRVLVVEDEASIRGLLARLLSRRGHTVIEAPSVPEALRLIESDSFDVVLCDLTLGDESGLDCLRRTQSIRPDLAQRFVFVTGAAGAASLQADQKLRVLAKPFTAADLERVLADVIAAPQAL